MINSFYNIHCFTDEGYVKEHQHYTQEIELAKFYKTMSEAQKEAKMKWHSNPEIL